MRTAHTTRHRQPEAAVAQCAFRRSELILHLGLDLWVTCGSLPAQNTRLTSTPHPNTPPRPLPTSVLSNPSPPAPDPTCHNPILNTCHASESQNVYAVQMPFEFEG